MGALSRRKKKECLADPRESWLVINSILFLSSVTHTQKKPAKQQFQKVKTRESAKVVTVPLTKRHGDCSIDGS